MKLLVVVSLCVMALFQAVHAVEERRFNIPAENSPSLGPRNAPVTIVEFLDFQ